jgi:predicted LPLAT superfamily acyltransferase
MSSWSGKSRGSVLGYQIFLTTIKLFGVSTAYFVLKIVSSYYVLFAGKQRQYIINFYQQALGLSSLQARKLSRKNFYLFGQTLIDRAAYLVGKGNTFTADFNNETSLVAIKNGGKGGILLSAHLGNWETAGNLLKERVSTTINVLMLQTEHEQIKQYLDKSTGGSKFNIIPIKDDLSHIIAINNALSNNEMIAIHADRYVEGMRYIELPFFGKIARFPYGPFLLASKFSVPITFVFALKANTFHYQLTATNPIQQKLTPEEIAKLYIEELENKVKQHPEQWFNYFDFYASC